MKNLAIIAYSRKAVNEYRNLFEKILENRVLISTYCMEDGSIYQPIQADLAVISSDDMLPLAKKQLASGITLVTAALTISRKGFEAIQALPQGYDTPVGELGDTLSGGERQRLGLARAFLHDADLMLLDEPTSNLDSLNEAIILRSLDQARAGKTVLLVSHRASTMRIADKVYSVEHGRMS